MSIVSERPAVARALRECRPAGADWYRDPGHGALPEDWPAEARAEMNDAIGRSAFHLRYGTPLPSTEPLLRPSSLRDLPREALDTSLDSYATLDLRDGADGAPAAVLGLSDIAVRHLPRFTMRVRFQWLDRHQSRLLILPGFGSNSVLLAGAPPRRMDVYAQLRAHLRSAGHGTRFYAVPYGEQGLLIDLSLPLRPEKGRAEA